MEDYILYGESGGRNWELYTYLSSNFWIPDEKIEVIKWPKDIIEKKLIIDKFIERYNRLPTDNDLSYYNIKINSCLKQITIRKNSIDRLYFQVYQMIDRNTYNEIGYKIIIRDILKSQTYDIMWDDPDYDEFISRIVLDL